MITKPIPRARAETQPYSLVLQIGRGSQHAAVLPQAPTRILFCSNRCRRQFTPVFVHRASARCGYARWRASRSKTTSRSHECDGDPLPFVKVVPIALSPRCQDCPSAAGWPAWHAVRHRDQARQDRNPDAGTRGRSRPLAARRGTRGRRQPEGRFADRLLDRWLTPMRWRRTSSPSSAASCVR
jgi:hypothetical protein